MSADPDKGIGGSCVCSNGATISTADTTGSNTGTLWEACPWSTLPPQAMITTSALAPTSTSAEWDYTMTDQYSDILVCQSAQLADVAGWKITECGGSSATISAAPSTTVEVGQRSQNVGTLTGEPLYSSVSSALEKICPTPSNNAYANCSADLVSVGDILYGDGKGSQGQGELDISVTSSYYSSTQLRDAMIQAAALTANTSATGKNCRTIQWAVTEEHETYHNTFTLCNSAGSADVQYFSGQAPGITDHLNALWEFKAWSGGEFECEEVVDQITEAVAFLAPEFVVGDEGADVIGNAICAQLEGS
ncbi:MAG: hypothetical protein Q9165_003718 [Trypethelium subeluteriae]